MNLQAMLAERMAGAVASGDAGSSLEEFAERRLHVRTITGDIQKFKFRPIQIQYMLAKKRAIEAGKPLKFLLLKYRRGGFSTLEQAAHYRLAVTKRRSWVATLAHTRPATEKMSEIPKLFREMDPLLKEKDDNEKVNLDFPGTKSKYTLGTAGGTAFGRGDTLQRVHGSEVAWWCPGPNQFDEVEKLIAGLGEATTGGEIVLESTPNGMEWFASKFKEALIGANDWTPIFLPWFADTTNRLPDTAFNSVELLDTISEKEKEVAKKHRLDLNQIAWRRAKVLSVGRLFPQEYPEDPISCFLTSGQAFFDLEILQAYLENLEKLTFPHWREEKIPGGIVVYAEPPEENETYVAASDTSEGLATSDLCGTGILRQRDGAQVAWCYGRWRPEVLARISCELCGRYNEAFWGIESNNHGHSVINSVQNTYGYKNLFYFRNERGEPGGGLSGKVGWVTNSQTRPVMFDELDQAMKETAIKIRDRTFISECMTFKLQPNGQYGADPGAHDDSVAMWAIAWQMRKYRRHKARVIILD